MNFWIYRALIIITINFTLCNASHKIYLLHGFGSLPLSLIRIEQELSKRGYSVKNYGYNSLYTELDTVGFKLYRELSSSKYDSVSFITHSMGALVVRSMCKYIDTISSFPLIFRMVMIAPPNRGAEIADFFSSNSILNTLLGPNLQKMRTDTNSYVMHLPLPLCKEAGVIIGIKRKGFWFRKDINEFSDGYLTPKRSVLGIEKDIAIVNEYHSMLTMKKEVVNLVVNFIENGSFLQKNIPSKKQG
ncbi:MAG: hypothetical protein N2053_10860 [Chitinispirillaceae bacterium]|nr:hypothetical protein [Chitinispirillaceae bacterium]